MAQEQETIRQFIEWGEKQDTVRAMVLTSSRAVPNAPVDVLSDYDVILILTDIRPFFESRAWLEYFGRVLVLYRDPISLEDGLETSGYVVQYEDIFKIDFTLWSVEMMKRVAALPQFPDEFDAGYRVLLDKDGLTHGLKPPTYKAYIPKPPTEADYHKKIEEFFLDAGYVVKLLWRDDMVAAKHLLDHFIKQEALIPMLEWRSEIDHNWAVKPGPYGRRLKKWLRPDLWAELEATYSGAGLEETREALFRTIALFRKVAVETGNLLGYAYPHELDKRAMAYLEKITKLSAW